jgi:hypothetical protein
MKFTPKSALFSESQIEKIEKAKKAKYLLDTEYKDVHVAVFYGEEDHPVSKSRYFALYFSYEDIEMPGKIMIADGSFIEDQKIVAAVSDDGEVILSRYRHDFVESEDGSVFIDGGRSYYRTNKPGRLFRIEVKDGETTFSDKIFA